MDEAYRTRAMRGEPEIREGIARLLMALPAEEVARGAQERCQLAWSVVRSPEAHVRDPHWGRPGIRRPRRGTRGTHPRKTLAHSVSPPGWDDCNSASMTRRCATPERCGM